MITRNKKLLAVILPVVAGFSVFYSISSLQGEDQENDSAWESEGEGFQPQSNESDFVGSRLRDPMDGGDNGDIPFFSEESQDSDAGHAGLAEKINSVLDRLGAIRKEQETFEQEFQEASPAPVAPSAFTPPTENTPASSGNPATRPRRLEIRGILVKGRDSCALIGGYIKREGEFLPGGYQIVRINRKSVHIRKTDGSEEKTLFLEPFSSPQSSHSPAPVGSKGSSGK